MRLVLGSGGSYTIQMADGMTYAYGSTLEIKDRNGNCITVTFTGTGDYDTITDTLGRVIYFNYGSYNDLQTITQTWEGMNKVLVTFNYESNYSIYPNFQSGLPCLVSVMVNNYRCFTRLICSTARITASNTILLDRLTGSDAKAPI